MRHVAESAITLLPEPASQPDSAASGTPGCHNNIGIWRPLTAPPDDGLFGSQLLKSDGMKRQPTKVSAPRKRLPSGVQRRLGVMTKRFQPQPRGQTDEP